MDNLDGLPRHSEKPQTTIWRRLRRGFLMNFLTRTVTAASDIFTWCSLFNSRATTSAQNPIARVRLFVDDHRSLDRLAVFHTNARKTVLLYAEWVVGERKGTGRSLVQRTGGSQLQLTIQQLLSFFSMRDSGTLISKIPHLDEHGDAELNGLIHVA